MTNEIEKWEYRAETFGAFWTGIKIEQLEKTLNVLYLKIIKCFT